MINSITLFNFQSHKNSVLDFVPGINAIIGASDQGKSAVLRSLYWLINNRPAGDSYISHWNFDGKGKQKDETSIVAAVDNKIIIRFRSKDKNGYRILDQDGKENVLEALRSDVPEAVSNALRIGDVNIQKQMDPPFLLSQSPGEVARFFNEIVRLDEIDLFLSDIDRRKRENTKDLKRMEEEKTAQEKSRERFSWLPPAKKLLASLEEMEAELLSLNSKQKEIDSSLRFCLAHIAENKALQEIGSILPQIEKLEKMQEKIKLKIAEISSLSESIVTYNTAVSESIRLSGLPALVPAVRHIETLISENAQMLERKNSIQSSLSSFQKAKIEISKNMDLQKTLIASLPAVCPTCGQEWIKEKE